MDNLFTENTKKDGLKEKRAKLKADRFKEQKAEKTSKVDEKLVKRYATKMTRREEKGLEPVPKKAKITNRQFNEEDDFGELGDIWNEPQHEVKSKEFARYKNGFAARDHHNVKAVIAPVGGQSYNPSIKDHKGLLKTLAQAEEKVVEKNLKALKTLNPLSYGFEVEVKAKADGESEEESESEVDSSEEEIDMDAPLAINAPVDRLGLKTTAERNRQKLSRAKQRAILDDIA